MLLQVLVVNYLLLLSGSSFYKYTIFLNLLSYDRHAEFCQFGASINKAPMKILVQLCMFSFILTNDLRVKLISRVELCLISPIHFFLFGFLLRLPIF